jgi:hypothetical protein
MRKSRAPDKRSHPKTNPKAFFKEMENLFADNFKEKLGSFIPCSALLGDWHAAL